MSNTILPENILNLIITQHLLDSNLSQCLHLRSVNRWFDEEVLYQLFYIQIKDLCLVVRGKRIPQHLAIIQLQGFFARHKVKPKSHARFRKAILRAAGHDVSHYGMVRESCFCSRQPQQCVREVVGSSKTSTCIEHNMLSAIAVAFGSLVIGFGREDNLGGFDTPILREPGFWSALVACYNNNLGTLRNVLQDFVSTNEMAKEDVAILLCACFVIAVRQDMPDMIDVLHEEAKDLEELSAKLGRMSYANSLLEAIRLGRCEVMRRLLKWQWKFNHNTLDYFHHVKLIIDDEHYPKRDFATQKEMLKILFDWTDTWRNIYEMKQFLIYVGLADQQHFLQAAIDMLKFQHFFRHERGAEGSFSAAEPLASLATSGNLEMLKLYFENDTLLLPHTEHHQSKEMRRALLGSELKRGSDARIDVMKLVMEYSRDLLESRVELQTLLIHHYDIKLDCWAWLAKLVGLSRTCVNFPKHTLGSILLEKAVESLHVETVRFLVNNGCQLINETMSPQVYEDDEEGMMKLRTVKRLLTIGKQGAFSERKVVETTFLPHSASTMAKRPLITRSMPTTKVTIEHGPSTSTSMSSKTSLRKSLAQTARKHITRREKKHVTGNSTSTSGTAD